MTNHETPLAITMGDPSGIGPEIIIKAIENLASFYPCIVVGDFGVMQRSIRALGSDLSVREIDSPGAAVFTPGILNLMSSGVLSQTPEYGKVSAQGGQAAFDAIIRAIDLAKQGRVSGIVTAPIHKEALALAGIRYPGHTEILADYGGADHVAMMLANDELRTVLVTIHCSLREAISSADFDAQMSAIRLAHLGGQSFGIENPRIAVAGLNPHAGESGLFGDEEILIIAPAIEAAKKLGIDVTGPWPGDTVFMQARNGKFDVVVAQYHDQGLIPIKYLGLEKGVNITLGLPFVRTSPDHGTAFDIAGQGIADPTSLEISLEYAVKLATAKRKEAA